MKHATLAAALALAAAACAHRAEERPANDVSYTNQTSKTTSVTVYPSEAVVGTTQTTSAALGDKEHGPIAASAQPDGAGRQQPDRRMSERIQKVLASDASLRDVALDRIRVVTADGHVTLSGLAPTLADKVAIEQRVREVKGVEAVDNEIEVLR